MTRAVLGLSGGVDSAVAAAFLAERGYEVHALFLDFGHGGADRARQAAAQLSLPFHIRPAAAALEEWVCAPFCRSYAAGLTPSPCIDCNERVKFPALFSFAQEIGAAVVATGHYARIRGGRLYRSPSDKDQSYLLYRLPLWMQARLIFPLGEMESKAQVRALAAARGLAAAGAKDSMDVCFIPDGDYVAYLEQHGVCPPPGDFVDEEGRVLGRHRGIHCYTPGQRRGLGVSAAGRLYVKRVDPEQNRVTLTLRDPLCRAFSVGRLCRWEAGEEFSCLIRVRHSRALAPGRVRIADGRARVEMERPIRAVAPGQSAVFYAPDGRVLGGGVIQKEEG